jgi:hypothetical protein
VTSSRAGSRLSARPGQPDPAVSGRSLSRHVQRLAWALGVIALVVLLVLPLRRPTDDKPLQNWLANLSAEF